MRERKRERDTEREKQREILTTHRERNKGRKGEREMQ